MKGDTGDREWQAKLLELMVPGCSGLKVDELSLNSSGCERKGQDQPRTGRGTLPEALDGTNAGLLIEPGNWEALASKIDRRLGDPAPASRLGEAAGASVWNLWDVKNVAAKAEAIYREVLSA